MTLIKSGGGTWKPRWNVTAEGAGFTDLCLTPAEDARLDAFLSQFEGTTEERTRRWNKNDPKRRQERVGKP